MLQQYNDFIERAAAGYILSQPLCDMIPATTSTVSAGILINMQRCGFTKALPALPTGVTGYIVTSVSLSSYVTAQGMMVGKLINMGSLDISGPTFTAGSAMPTVTTLGQSRPLASAVIVEVTTVLNATPGAYTITYADQDGNADETTTSRNLVGNAPVRSVGYATLNTPDWGARSITTATRTGGTTPTGVLQFWGVVPIAMYNISPVTINFCTSENIMTSGVNVPRLGAGDVIGAFTFNATSVRSLTGFITVVGDD